MAITDTMPKPYLERKFSVAEYHRMAELGFFAGQRVELIAGEVSVMTPMSPRHFAAVSLAQQALQEACGKDLFLRVQGPLTLLEDTEPEPDIAVVTGSPRDYADSHPRGALLVVEVADSSLAYDRATKASLYARAGIQEYWVVNLVERRVEVFREPAAMVGQPFDAGYRSLRVSLPGESVAPLCAAAAPITVDDLLP